MHNTFKEIKEAIKNDYWQELTDHADPYEWLMEFGDGLVPVYYSDIIDDWKEMPAEFVDSGIDICSAESGIFDRMTADLWNYYQDQTRTAYEQVKGELENANA